MMIISACMTSPHEICSMAHPSVEMESKRKEKSGLRVDSVTREDIPQALVGLKLAEVNGESVMETTYDQALATVKAAGRPLTIKFVKP